MTKSTFIYVTYIRTTPEKLWEALVDPKFQRSYWAGASFNDKLTKGLEWKLAFQDGTVADIGEVLEARPPKRLVLKWRHEMTPSMKAEGFTRCTMELEPQKAGAVKLTVTHTMNRPKSKFIEAVGGGWPFILSNLKSLLETGKVVLKDF